MNLSEGLLRAVASDYSSYMWTDNGFLCQIDHSDAKQCRKRIDDVFATFS